MNTKQGIFRSLLISAILTARVACPSTVSAAYHRDKLSLNGTWDFYPNNGTARFDIKVPAYWDETIGNGHPADWATLGYGVYKKSFSIPAGMMGKQIFLNIQALTVLGKVFINGTGVNVASTGNYLMMFLPYCMDITSYANMTGINKLELHVYGRSDFPADAKNGDKYLYPFGTEMLVGRKGICGDVSIVAYPKLYISDVQVITDLKKNVDPADDTISVKVTVTNRSGSNQKVTIKNSATLKGGSVEKTFPDQSVKVRNGEIRTVTIRDVSWANAKYWWPHDPKLYILSTSIVQGPITIDTVSNRFGFRQFYAKSNSNYFELNGIRCNLRGDNIDNLCVNMRWGHANDASIAYTIKLLDEWKTANLNVIRNHCASLFSDEILNHCDEIGMMYIDETPYWQSVQQGLDTGSVAALYMSRYLTQWVKSRKNHPSLIMYSASNEEEQTPLSMFTVRRSAILAYDRTRPVFNEGAQKFSQYDDQINYHYTSADGSWNTADPIIRKNLYTIFPDVGTTKPRGEGECMWACSDGLYPKLDASGAISGQCELDGSTPDAPSSAVWARQCARALRGARYQGIADYRSFLNIYHAFDWIEGPIMPEWTDWSAPGLKPVVMLNRHYNPFDPNYPSVIYGDAYAYYKNSHAPVAAFDTACDAENMIGAIPPVYVAGRRLTRTIVLYNDEFSGGNALTINWVARYKDPGGAETVMASTKGSFDKTVNYGEKAVQDISFTLPAEISGNKILDLKLTVTKNGVVRFEETNNLGYINGPPAAKLHISNSVIDLGPLRSQTGLLHKIKLINIGGGASEIWTATGYAPWLTLNWTSGNLRGEQEIFYTVNTAGMHAESKYSTTVTFTGSHGTTAKATITIGK